LKYSLAVLSTFLAGVAGALAAQEKATSPVYVVLWFDTEDYILPQSDDAAKRLAEFLTQQGIRATFKVVGEKGRVLERRGRNDVIAALARHEIGYHSNTHSQHPTPAEYESLLDWENGIEEFTRREYPGFDDVRRIFGQPPSCYGQPGNSWAPQAHPALKKWGVKVYLDEASQVGLDGEPFWYGGILNIFNTRQGAKLRPNNDFSNLAEVKERFHKAYLESAAQPGGGIISIYFHPCEFIHKEFWDGVNFAHGANPPPGDWKVPAMKSREASERAFQFFEEFVLYMKSLGARFVTASDGLDLYSDIATNHRFTTEELAGIARQVTPEVSFQVHGRYAISASEVLALLNRYVARKLHGESDVPLQLESTPYGPGMSPAAASGTNEVPWYNFSRGVLDVADTLAKTSQVPDPVWLGSTPVSPASYLVALAHVATVLLNGGKPPAMVTVGAASLAAARYVAKDSPELWDWPIHRPGFDGAHLLDLARLQTWTLKPAMLRVEDRAGAVGATASR
jgi:hypothetical protein